jgi:hypothetical protein
LPRLADFFALLLRTSGPLQPGDSALTSHFEDFGASPARW